MKLDLAAYKFPTGTVIANRAVQKNGDYKRIAFISRETPDKIEYKIKRPSKAIKDFCNKYVTKLSELKPLNA